MGQMTGVPAHCCQGEWLSLSLPSPGQQLDEILQLAMNRMEPSLAEGPHRTQALTLLLWVRPALDEWGREARGPSLALTILPAQVTKALVLRYHPLSSCLTDKVSGGGAG